jgi:hypothetical protein
VTLLPQKLKNTPLLHFEIPLVVLSLKLIFFFPFQSPRLHCRSHGRISIHLGDSGHSSSSTSPFGSHRSWETVLTSPSGSHRNTPDRRYPSTIITRRKALTRRHLKHISEASRSEYLHRTAPEIIHTMLIPRKPQFFDKTAKKKKKRNTAPRTRLGSRQYFRDCTSHCTRQKRHTMLPSNQGTTPTKNSRHPQNNTPKAPKSTPIATRERNRPPQIDSPTQKKLPVSFLKK